MADYIVLEQTYFGWYTLWGLNFLTTTVVLWCDYLQWCRWSKEQASISSVGDMGIRFAFPFWQIITLEIPSHIYGEKTSYLKQNGLVISIII